MKFILTPHYLATPAAHRVLQKTEYKPVLLWVHDDSIELSYIDLIDGVLSLVEKDGTEALRLEELPELAA